jgi:hypothetical protein
MGMRALTGTRGRGGTRALVLLASTLAFAAAGDANARGPSAHEDTALTSVNEYGSLKMQSSKGTTVAEKGVCWGSFNCAVVMQMTLSGTLVNSNFTVWLQGGSISGAARARIRSATTVAAYFSGTIRLHGGTRGRSHAQGVARFQGMINRTTYALTIHISGRLQLQ